MKYYVLQFPIEINDDDAAWYLSHFSVDGPIRETPDLRNALKFGNLNQAVKFIEMLNLWSLRLIPVLVEPNFFVNRATEAAA